MQLEKAMFVISIDVDVGSKKLGVINRGKNDANVLRNISEYQVGKIDEVALPLIVEMLNDFGIPATFAIRGQLTEVNNSILELLLKSSVEHDIGAHGYYHKEFASLSRSEAENELRLISTGMKKFGISPKSFVFPRNSLAYTDLLEKYAYECFRSYGDFINDCMLIEKHGQLYNIHPSLYLDQSLSSIFPKKIVEIAVAKRLPFHIWFHSWNFGETRKTIQKNIQRMLLPLLNSVNEKEETGELTCETMLSAAERVENLGI